MLPALAHPRALAARLTGPDRLLGPALALAAALLVAGWFLPILTVEELWWIEDEVSIAQGLVALPLADVRFTDLFAAGKARAET